MSFLLLIEAADWLEQERDNLVKTVSRKIYNIIKSYRSSNMPAEESIKTMEITLGYIIDFLRSREFSLNLDNGLVNSGLIKFEEGIAYRRVVYEIKLVDLLRGIKIFRDELWSMLAKKMGSRMVSSVDFLKLEKRINSLINYVIISVSNSYIDAISEFIQSQETALKRWEEVVKSASNIELKVPCRNEFAVIVRMQAEAIARRARFDEEEIQDIKTAVGEACDNAIEHGVSEKGVDVHYHLSLEELTIEITDYGPGFEPSGRGDEPPDPFAERGRGIFLMKYLMDRAEIYSKPGEGTMTVLSKKRKPFED